MYYKCVCISVLLFLNIWPFFHCCCLFVWNALSLKLAVQYVIKDWLVLPSQIAHFIIYSCTVYTTFCCSDLSNFLEVNALSKKYQCYVSHMHKDTDVYLPESNECCVYIQPWRQLSIWAAYNQSLPEFIRKWLGLCAVHVFNSLRNNPVHTSQKAPSKLTSWLSLEKWPLHVLRLMWCTHCVG